MSEYDIIVRELREGAKVAVFYRRVPEIDISAIMDAVEGNLSICVDGLDPHPVPAQNAAGLIPCGWCGGDAVNNPSTSYIRCSVSGCEFEGPDYDPTGAKWNAIQTALWRAGGPALQGGLG